MKLLNEIPLKRLFLYFLALCSIPTLLVLFSLYQNKQYLNQVREELSSVSTTSKMIGKQQERNKGIIQHYSLADRQYIDQKIETIDLLEREVKKLKKISEEHAFGGSEKIRSRLQFLTTKNKIEFSEGAVTSSPLFQETVESMQHPVEVDSENLKEILSSIEGVTIDPYQPDRSRPLLIITQFNLQKKKGAAGDEVFQLNIKMLKREFL